MANEEHVAILRRGVQAWNEWRNENPDIRPDLNQIGILAPLSARSRKLVRLEDNDEAFDRGCIVIRSPERRAEFCGTNLDGIDLSYCDISELTVEYADINAASFEGSEVHMGQIVAASMVGSEFTDAALIGVRFYNVLLRRAIFNGTVLSESAFHGCDLSRCRLLDADMGGTVLVNCNLTRADVESCFVYGSSIWDVNLKGARQSDLVINKGRGAAVTVDNLEVAQFIHLLLNNRRVNEVIDTITSKVVLVLGRFGQRKPVLDKLRNQLRERGYVPVIFDFTKPSTRSTDQTINLLARMARFVIADITDARCVPQELKGFVESNPTIPVQPLLLASASEYGMFEHFRAYPWVLEPHRYESTESLLASLSDCVLLPVESKAREIAARRRTLDEEIARG